MLVLIGSGAAHAQAAKTLQLEGGVVISLPAATAASQEHRPGDSVAYSLKGSAGKTLLDIYVGNNPAPLRAPRAASASKASIAGLAAFTVRWTNARGKFAVVRLRLPGEQWPAFVQFSYGPLKGADADAVESVISSAHLRVP